MAIFWAPEIAYFNNQFHLYYSVSTFGTQVSGIGLATNTTLDPQNPAYQWVDQGPVIQSTVGSAYNTIDPGILRESNGNLWMVFGSYWNGIYITQLSPTTGKRIAANSPTFRLADREPGIEAAQMVERDGKFYLFVNWGTCCAGTSSTYNIRVGRSSSPTGPFVDKNGMSMVNGAGIVVPRRPGAVSRTRTCGDLCRERAGVVRLPLLRRPEQTGRPPTICGRSPGEPTAGPCSAPTRPATTTAICKPTAPTSSSGSAAWAVRTRPRTATTTVRSPAPI